MLRWKQQVRIGGVFCLAVAVLIGAAVRGSAQVGDAAGGKRLFRAQDWSATGLTCIHCHAHFNEKKTPDGYIRPGHSLYNSGYRTEFHAWDGRKVGTLPAAISICMKRWTTERDSAGMGTAPAKHWIRQIVAYLRSEEMVYEKKAKPIEPIYAEKIPSDRQLKAGEARLGIPVFRRSCSTCHQPDGSGPAPTLIRNGYSRYQIARKIRGINNPGLNGLVMPPFSRDRLSDREVINVAAYVYEM